MIYWALDFVHFQYTSWFKFKTLTVTWIYVV